jgi:hypothetical protein
LFAFGGFGVFLVFVVVAGHAVLRRARQGGFHLSLRYTEMAEGSSPHNVLATLPVNRVNDGEDLC